jgi:hypothetical protein
MEIAKGGDTFSGETNHPRENAGNEQGHRPMEKITESTEASSPLWETLLAWCRVVVYIGLSPHHLKPSRRRHPVVGADCVTTVL